MEPNFVSQEDSHSMGLTRDHAPKKIPRPKNAFMLFSLDYRKKLRDQHRLSNNQEVSVRLGQMWKTLPAQEKAKYFAKAKQEEIVHRQKYPDYKYAPKKRIGKYKKTLVDNRLISVPCISAPPQPPAASVNPYIANWISQQQALQAQHGQVHNPQRDVQTSHTFHTNFSHSRMPVKVETFPISMNDGEMVETTIESVYPNLNNSNWPDAGSPQIQFETDSLGIPDEESSHIIHQSGQNQLLQNAESAQFSPSQLHQVALIPVAGQPGVFKASTIQVADPKIGTPPTIDGSKSLTPRLPFNSPHQLINPPGHTPVKEAMPKTIALAPQPLPMKQQHGSEEINTSYSPHDLIAGNQSETGRRKRLKYMTNDVESDNLSMAKPSSENDSTLAPISQIMGTISKTMPGGIQREDHQESTSESGMVQSRDHHHGAHTNSGMHTCCIGKSHHPKPPQVIPSWGCCPEHMYGGPPPPHHMQGGYGYYPMTCPNHHHYKMDKETWETPSSCVSSYLNHGLMPHYHCHHSKAPLQRSADVSASSPQAATPMPPAPTHTATHYSPESDQTYTDLSSSQHSLPSGTASYTATSSNVSLCSQDKETDQPVTDLSKSSPCPAITYIPVHKDFARKLGWSESMLPLQCEVSSSCNCPEGTENAEISMQQVNDGTEQVATEDFVPIPSPHPPHLLQHQDSLGMLSPGSIQQHPMPALSPLVNSGTQQYIIATDSPEVLAIEHDEKVESDIPDESGEVSECRQAAECLSILSTAATPMQVEGYTVMINDQCSNVNEKSVFATPSTLSPMIMTEPPSPISELPPTPELRRNEDIFATPTVPIKNRNNILENKAGLTPGTLSMNVRTPTGELTPMPGTWQDFDVLSGTPLASHDHSSNTTSKQTNEVTPPGRPNQPNACKHLPVAHQIHLITPNEQDSNTCTTENVANTEEEVMTSGSSSSFHSISTEVTSSSSSSTCSSFTSGSSSCTDSTMSDDSTIKKSVAKLTDRLKSSSAIGTPSALPKVMAPV